MKTRPGGRPSGLPSGPRPAGAEGTPAAHGAAGLRIDAYILFGERGLLESICSALPVASSQHAQGSRKCSENGTGSNGSERKP